MSEQHPSSPTNAEDRKAAAALSSLDAQHQSSDEDDHAHGSKPSKQAATIDQEALERAISRLEMSSKSKGLPERGGKDEGGRGKGKATVGDGGDVAEEEAKKKIRVDAGDVALLVRSFLGSIVSRLIIAEVLICGCCCCV